MKVLPWILSLATGGLLTGTAVAQSADRPWSVALGQNISHESNVLNAGRGAEQSDIVSTTTLSGGLNAPLGRQRAYANASVNHQRYSELGARNADGYAASAGLEGSTIEHLSGSLKLNFNRRQADFNVGGVSPVTVSNIERSDELALNLAWGGVGLLGLDVGTGQRKVAFSAPEFAARAYRQDSARVGLGVRPSAILSFSVGLGGDHTKFLAAAPGQSAPERSRRQDVYLAAQWVPSGLSALSLRLASSRVKYESSAVSDFDGLTGSLAWTWKPTGALSLTTTWSRDSGQESGFLRLNGSNTVSATDFSRLSTSQGLRASYDLTAKVTLSASANEVRRSFLDSATAVASQDRTQSLALSARWAATRTVALTCAAVQDARSSDSVNLLAYTNNRVGCSAQLSLD